MKNLKQSDIGKPVLIKRSTGKGKPMIFQPSTYTLSSINYKDETVECLDFKTQDIRVFPFEMITVVDIPKAARE